MSKEKKKYLQYFIVLLPLIDFITSICTWNNYSFSLGLFLKGLFLVYATIYLLRNAPKKKIFFLMGIYIVVYLTYLYMNHLNLANESINLIKIFYLPTLILFFNYYENKNITKRTLTIVCLFYLLLYIVPFFLGLGHNISEIYPNKELYLSYFYIGNELSNVFIILLPIAFTYLLESHSYLLKGVYALFIIIAMLLMSTKTFYASILMILLYFCMVNRKKVLRFIKKNQIKTLVSCLVILLAIIIYIPKMDLTQNIKTSLEHYEVDSLTDFLTFENIDHVIYSNRLSFLKNVHESYQESSPIEKNFGLGRVKVNNLKNVEIDIFDIFYSIGIIGTIFYLLFFIYVLKESQIKEIYKFTFVLLLIISCFTGHVLISPFTSTFLALLFLVSKNDKGKMKKNILLVTNMYPSKEYPHYGIFVKNNYELLVKNNLTVDLAIMYKTHGKLNKFISYVKMCGTSLLKAIFNNYDYIYVHFISHTPAGVIIPYLCSKNTKLVLNVHGNDLVADTDADKNYMWLSKLFLKFADVVISPSKYFASILKNEYKIPTNKIVVYPSGGVDTNKFKKIEKKEAFQKSGLDKNKKYFGYVARLEKDKGYDTLLLAMNELNKQKKLKDIKFLIVGSGSEEPLFDELVTKYNLENLIERKPLVSQEELVNIYNAIDALIYPTRRKSESLGLTGLEAMACETLVIGSNKYGPSDYLENNKNALTFTPEDYKELVKKIEEFLKMDEKEKNKLTKNARKKSLEYSEEQTKEILLKVFK